MTVSPTFTLGVTGRYVDQMVRPRTSCWIETTQCPPTWPANVTVPESHACTGEPPGYARVTPRLPGSQSWTGAAKEDTTGTGEPLGHCQRSPRRADRAGMHTTSKRQHDTHAARTALSRRWYNVMNSSLHSAFATRPNPPERVSLCTGCDRSGSLWIAVNAHFRLCVTETTNPRLVHRRESQHTHTPPVIRQRVPVR